VITKKNNERKKWQSVGKLKKNRLQAIAASGGGLRPSKDGKKDYLLVTAQTLDAEKDASQKTQGLAIDPLGSKILPKNITKPEAGLIYDFIY